MARANATIAGTDKEPEVARLLADGLGQREIARRLGLADHKAVKRYAESTAYMLMVEALRSARIPLGPNVPPQTAPEITPRAKPRLLEPSPDARRALPEPPASIESDEAFDDPLLDMTDMRKKLTRAVRPWIRTGMLTPAVVQAVNAALGIARFEHEVADRRGRGEATPELEAERDRLERLLLGATKGRK